MDEQKNRFFQANEREETSTSEYFDFAGTVARARSGDEEAIEALYQKSVSLLEWEVRKEYGRPEDVEDMLQESYLRIFKSLDQLKDPNRFLGWATVICRRTVLEHRTRKDRIEHLVDYWPETSEAGEPSLDLLPADEYKKDQNPDLHVDAEVLSETVKSILDTLPEVQQMCLLLWMSGYKYQEIAEELGVPLGTVKGNMSRAKKKVAEALKEMREKGTFDYKAVSSDPFAAFLRLWEESIANSGTGAASVGANLLPKVQTALGAGGMAASAGTGVSFLQRPSTAVLTLLMVLVIAVGTALGIQRVSPEMTAETGPRETTRVTQTRVSETTSTTGPADEGPANNGVEETTGPAAAVTTRTPAPADPNGGANAGRTNTTTAVVQQAAAGTGGPLIAQVVNISDVPGGDFFNLGSGLGSNIADNVTVREPSIDAQITSLKDVQSDGVLLYLFLRNHLGKPITVFGFDNVNLTSFLGEELLNTNIVLRSPIRMEDSDEQWFSVFVPSSMYPDNSLYRYELENVVCRSSLRVNYQ